MFSLSQIKGPLFILLSSVFFSMTGTLQALAPESATPIAITEVRMTLGALTLLLWCSFRGILPESWQEIPKFPLLMVVLSVLFYQVFFFSAVLQVGVAVGSVVSIGTTPVWAAVVAMILYGTKPSRLWYFATAFAVAGVVLINGVDFDVENFYALALPVMAGLCYAIEITYAQKLITKLRPETAMLLEMAGVSLLLMPVMFFVPVEWIFTSQGMAISIGLGVFTAGIAFSLFVTGLQYTSSAVASTLALSEPLAAACLGLFLLHESITTSSFFGMTLVFAAIVLLLFEQSPRSEE